MKKIETILHGRVHHIQEIMKELMIEKCICPIPSLMPKKLFYKETSDTFKIVTYATDQCIFSPSQYVDNEEFILETNLDLREIMSFQDFSRFLQTFSIIRGCSISDIFFDDFHDLSLLYFIDKKLFKKYARNQVEKFLKDTIIIVEDNCLKYSRKKKYVRIKDGQLQLPKGWDVITGIKDGCEMVLTYDGVKLRKMREEK